MNVLSPIDLMQVGRCLSNMKFGVDAQVLPTGWRGSWLSVAVVSMER